MAEWASVLLRLCSFSHFYFDAQACRCRHVDESIQTKQVDFPRMRSETRGCVTPNSLAIWA